MEAVDVPGDCEPIPSAPRTSEEEQGSFPRQSCERAACQPGLQCHIDGSNGSISPTSHLLDLGNHQGKARGRHSPPDQ